MKNEAKRYYMLEDGEDHADLYIFGDISSWGQWGEDDPTRSAYNIVKELQAVQAPSINVHINSNGGDVSEGLAIYNTLKNSGKTVTTYCDGFACSAASVVFMAGSKRIMSNASLLMIHNAWMFTMGNSSELRKQADDLEKVNQTAVEAYKSVAKISEDDIKKMMDESTWISAADALSYGFATEISGETADGAPKQSAMQMIHDQLTAKKPTPQPALTLEDFKEAMRSVLKEAHKPEEVKTETKPTDGWANYFGGKRK